MATTRRINERLASSGEGLIFPKEKVPNVSADLKKPSAFQDAIDLDDLRFEKVTFGKNKQQEKEKAKKSPLSSSLPELPNSTPPITLTSSGNMAIPPRPVTSSAKQPSFVPGGPQSFVNRQERQAALEMWKRVVEKHGTQAADTQALTPKRGGYV